MARTESKTQAEWDREFDNSSEAARLAIELWIKLNPNLKDYPKASAYLDWRRRKEGEA